MEQIQPYLDEALAFARTGYNTINGTQGLLIALAATVFMQNWKQWIPAALAAGVVHIGVDTLAPVLAGKAALKLPPLVEQAFWQKFGLLAVGYLLVIAVMFFGKSLLMRAAKGGSPKKA